ncbi:MAG: putative efflux protein, MATE family [uncultured archaeon A07HR60]|nr:MAG: putative efflux protein, MATE family [uncultured archaeon A07HR60]
MRDVVASARSAARWGGDVVADGLERAHVIRRDRLTETVDLAWPRVITGFAIMSKNTADLAMVGWVLGSPAVAGLAFAFAYWQLVKFVSIGLAGGTVALVSQNYGGDEPGRAALVVKQSLWVAAAIAIPLVAGLIGLAEPLIGLLGAAPDARQFGVTYLVFTAPALLFEFFNMIASRTYAGVGDTFTPMVMRAGGAVVNVVLTAWFIFGMGLGVLGAAVGTSISIGLVTVALSWGMTGRSYFGYGASPVPLTTGGKHFDRELSAQLVRISAPLMGRRLGEGIVVFPLLAVAASFGSVAVAAYEVGRRVRALINSFSWGFSIAASTLVGQRLGAGDEAGAAAYGREIIRLSVVVYLLAAAAVILARVPIAQIFVEDPAAVSLGAVFVTVAALSVITMGVDGSATGTLRGAGDTRWPFAASLIGLYVFALPLAVLGTVTPLGIAGLYLAMLVETIIPAGLNLHRFRSNRWRAISRSYRPSSAD